MFQPKAKGSMYCCSKSSVSDVQLPFSVIVSEFASVNVDAVKLAQLAMSFTITAF